MSSYLQNLTIRLASGLGSLDDARREKHTAYFLNAQRDDGGFAGRMGESDLYYTAFGLRALSVLGGLYGEPAEKAAGFLRGQLAQHQTIVDFFSLFYAANLLHVSAGIDIFESARDDWQENVAQFLHSLRREDGGYAKAPEGHAGSTYHTFLVVLVLELLQKPTPDAGQVVAFLDSRKDPEGGWREIRASKRAGTNPTAAAVATLHILAHQLENGHALDHDTKELTLDYLCEMQTDEGGLRANTRIPIADLLSSFTGALTLDDLDSFAEMDVRLYRKFVDSMEIESGGFRAALWDEAHDVEYSFYGLGCLSLLENYSNKQRG
ncbi:MAG: prenyltransferase/squalene oxidase repeat-containing protein [Planctomycetota bacterium]